MRMAQESISSRQICFLWSAANTDTDNDFMQGRKYNRVIRARIKDKICLWQGTLPNWLLMCDIIQIRVEVFQAGYIAGQQSIFFCPLCNFVYSHPCPLDTEQCGFRYSVLEFHAHSEYHFAVHIFRKTFVFQVENIVRVMRKWAKDNRVPVWKNANNVYILLK